MLNHLVFSPCMFAPVRVPVTIRALHRAQSTAANDVSAISAVRGMHDHLVEDASKRARVASSFARQCLLHGYLPIETPLVEESRLFARSLGLGSDVVTKEMFAVSRGSVDEAAVAPSQVSDSPLTLRPEGTAGVIRALLSAGAIRTPSLNSAATTTQPLHRLSYNGPMFRYERPQRGRYRQFTQLGVECVGGRGAPAADVEVIALAQEFLREALPGVPVRLLINSLGDVESMSRYSAALQTYFSGVIARNDASGQLSPASLARLQRGAVLRILDSKDDGDQRLVAGAPRIADHWTAAASSRFAEVRSGLAYLGVPFAEAPTLVRGLDYYRHTIFEFVTDDEGRPEETSHTTAGRGLWDCLAADSDSALKGAAASQPPASGTHGGTVLAGGRYDGLAAVIAGKGGDVPSIGWAAGLERLVLLSPSSKPAALRGAFSVSVLPVVSAACSEADGRAIALESSRIAAALRKAGFHTLLAESAASVGKSVAAASKKGRASVAVIVGDDEMRSRVVVVKDLVTGAQLVAHRLDQLLAAVGQAAGSPAARPPDF